MNKLLMLLSNIQRVIPDEDSMEITILPYNEVQVADSGNMPTNYEYEEQDCINVLKSLRKVVDYSLQSEMSNYIEWMGDKGIDIPGLGDENGAPASETIDKEHILHDILVLHEVLEEIENNQL